jgi:hypothetical protein
MPHLSDVRSTSHDQHDPILVAALAADDLAGTDRDHALELTRTCTDCATLHDDLLALARATAAAPPPFATRPRDFQLTPADAARLRPSGWRRLVAAISSSRTIVSRPLGVGLATLGIVGLLVGNVQLGSGASAGAPSAAAGDQVRLGAAVSAASSASQYGVGAALGASAGSANGQSPVPAAVAEGPVGGPTASGLESAQTSPPSQLYAGPLAPSVAGDKSLASPTSDVVLQALDSSATEPFRPLNLLFGAAVVIGLGLLAGSILRGRRTA